MHSHEDKYPARIRTWYLQVTSPSRYEWAIGAGPYIIYIKLMAHSMNAYETCDISTVRDKIEAYRQKRRRWRGK